MNRHHFAVVPLVLVLLVTLAVTSRPAAAVIRSFTVVNIPLDGADPAFQIRVICTKAFAVSSLYATVRDPDNSIDLHYAPVLALSNIFGPDFVPPTSWQIAHVPFDPAPGAASTEGYELLSQLAVATPVGIATGGSFDLFGSRAGHNGDETMSVAAVVETAPAAANPCQIVIVDH
jgi:hypothetical protein